MRRAAAAGALALLAACGPEDAGPQPEPFVLGPVVRTRLAELARAAELPALPAPAEDLGEDVRGLVVTRATADQRFRDLPLEDIKTLGPAAIPALAALLLDPEVDGAQRAAAAELLAVLDHPVAAEHLLALVEQAPEAWLRRLCVWHLGHTTQDRCVPRVVLRLKYEQDHEAFIWIAVTLARFGNFSGLDALLDLARRGTPEGESARAQLAALEAEYGRPGNELRALWNSSRATELPQHTPSPALRAAVWTWIAELSGEHFQLRGVDDARYVLARLGPWAVDEVAAALADEDWHARLHCAQVLERMGPRAASAGPALLRTLSEPLLAPAAAEALGRVGYPPAEPALIRASEPGNAYELRVGAVIALGRLGLATSADALRARFAEATDPALADLRLAAATSLVLLDHGDEVADWLVAQLAGDGDAAGAEVALESWIERGVDAGRTAFVALRDAWRRFDPPPGTIPDTQRAAQRRKDRAAALQELLPLSDR
jgi:HEAT repeat protein